MQVKLKMHSELLEFWSPKSCCSSEGQLDYDSILPLELTMIINWWGNSKTEINNWLGGGGLAQLRNDTHEVVMTNHGYTTDDWLDVANMTAAALLEFLPTGKWSLGICQCGWWSYSCWWCLSLQYCCTCQSNDVILPSLFVETTSQNMSWTSLVSVFFCHANSSIFLTVELNLAALQEKLHDSASLPWASPTAISPFSSGNAYYGNYVSCSRTSCVIAPGASISCATTALAASWRTLPWPINGTDPDDASHA